MIKYVCDSCLGEVRPSELVRGITLPDGEHPHNGSPMTKKVDYCAPCIGERLCKLKAEVK